MHDEIITDGSGRPIRQPDPPGQDANIDEIVAYLRAHAKHRDEVASVASGAFARRFRTATKGRR